MEEQEEEKKKHLFWEKRKRESEIGWKKEKETPFISRRINVLDNHPQGADPMISMVLIPDGNSGHAAHMWNMFFQKRTSHLRQLSA